MSKVFEDIFDACLEDLKKGEDVSKITDKYPEYKEELFYLLSIAGSIDKAEYPEISSGALDTCLLKVADTIAKEKGKSYVLRFPKIDRLKMWVQTLIDFRMPVFVRVATYALVISLVFWGTTNIYANAMPGDFLYPFKLATEKVRIAITISPKNKAELRLTFSEKRTSELMRQLQETGKIEPSLIKSMLEESYKALNEISKVSRGNSGVYLSKLEHVNSYQENILENIKREVNPENKKLIVRAIKTCNNRKQWMQKIISRQVPIVKWGPHCRFKQEHRLSTKNIK